MAPVPALAPTRPQPDAELVRVEGLCVSFPVEQGRVVVVEDVSFTVDRGTTLGIVGESGSGKTVAALAMLGLLPPGADVRGDVTLDGVNLRALSGRGMRHVLGRDIGMIFQEPRRSLDPAFTVGDQIAEVVRRHLQVSRSEAWKRAIAALDMVMIPQAARRAREYPHTFSGGMCQRVMIARAIACQPKLLIADEPTTALDVTVQAEILGLLRQLQSELDLGTIFITHDLAVVAEMATDVLVMYSGQVVEHADVRTVFHGRTHPYTAGLLASLPQRHVGTSRLSSIPGVVPAPHAWPSGCRFHPRCPSVDAGCRGGEISLDVVGPTQEVRCRRWAELEGTP